MNKTVLLLSACLVASIIPANARRNNKEVEKTVTTTTTVVRGDTTITTTTVTSTPAEQESQPGKRSFKSRLSLGGYGEAVMTRNFYSDNVNRYSKAEDYKDAKGHNRFDLPHAVIMLGFDFGVAGLSARKLSLNMVARRVLSRWRRKKQANGRRRLSAAVRSLLSNCG